LGGGDVFLTPLRLQRRQPGLLLRQRFLRGGDVVGLAAGLNRGQLCLGGRQVGARLQHLDLG